MITAKDIRAEYECQNCGSDCKCKDDNKDGKCQRYTGVIQDANIKRDRK